MPTIPINQESPSVFDSLFEQVMKRMSPSTPDISDIGGLMGPIGVPAGLISKIPFDQVAERNKRLLNMLKIYQSTPETIKAVEAASKSHPRVLAHVNELSETPQFFSNRGILGQTFLIPDNFPNVEVDPRQLKKFGPYKNLERDTAETVGHELTHVAQNLWNKGGIQKPYEALSQTFGYTPNIFEEGARKAGTNFANRHLGTPEPGLIQKFLDMFDLNK